MRGFSTRNLKYMRAFAKAWPERQIVQDRLALLTWFHQIALLEKLNSPEERLAYAAAVTKHGWSRDILVIQIETGFLKRLGKSVHNFARTLPKPQSDLAAQTLKDPYVFDFLELTGDVEERRLERSLIEKNPTIPARTGSRLCVRWTSSAPERCRRGLLPRHAVLPSATSLLRCRRAEGDAVPSRGDLAQSPPHTEERDEAEQSATT